MSAEHARRQDDGGPARLTAAEREQLVRDLWGGQWSKEKQRAWDALPPQERMLILAAREALERQWAGADEPTWPKKNPPDQATVQRCLAAAGEAEDLLLTGVERCLSMRLISPDAADQVVREAAATIAAMESMWQAQ